MNKPESLRQHLLASVKELKHNPDRLLVFIDDGNIRCTGTNGLSFEYSYTLNLIFTDFAGHPDAIAIPLLAWLRVNQHEILANLERNKTAIKFEADIIDNSKVDLSIFLPLTERVIVSQPATGALSVVHAPEPLLSPHLPANHWVVRDDQGNIMAEWDSLEPTGVDLEPIHPGRADHPIVWMGVDMGSDNGG